MSSTRIPRKIFVSFQPWSVFTENIYVFCYRGRWIGKVGTCFERLLSIFEIPQARNIQTSHSCLLMMLIYSSFVAFINISPKTLDWLVSFYLHCRDNMRNFISVCSYVQTETFMSRLRSTPESFALRSRAVDADKCATRDRNRKKRSIIIFLLTPSSNSCRKFPR